MAVQLSAGTLDGANFGTEFLGALHYEQVVVGWNIGGAFTQHQVGAGNVTTSTQRVTLANDDPAVTDLAAIEVLLGTIDTDTGNMATSLGSLDNAVDGSYLNVNLNMAGTDAQAGEGVITASTQRVTIATDDDGVAHLSTIAGDTTSLDGKVTTCDTGNVVIASGTITAVTAISNALPAGDNNIGNVDIIIPSDVAAVDGSAYGKGILVQGNDGTDRTSVLVDTDGHLQVDVLSGAGGGTTGEGIIDATTQRVTIATDDDGVAHLSTIAGDTTSLDGKVTACNTGAVVIASGTVTTITNAVAVTGTFWQATQPVSAATLPLPTGAATEATLATIAGDVASIEGAVYVDDADWTDSTSSHLLVGGVYQSVPQAITDGDVGPIQVTANGYVIASINGTVTVDGSGVTQPVSAASLPLPTGASTEATLSTLNGKVTACNTGAVVLASGTVTTITNPVAVTGTFWQATQPVSAASLPLPTGAATEATLGTIDTDTGNIAAGYAAEGSALGSGVLLQGDDGTDRTNVLVDTDGHLQVDVLTGAGGTQYAVDAALGATPTGTLAVAIRDDALAALTPVEGDAIGLRVDANGALWVIPSGTVTVDGSGVTQPVSAASLPLPTGASTEATLSTLNGKVTACNTGAVVLSSGTVTTVSSVTAIANALPAGDNNIGNVDIVTVPAPLNVVGSGTEAAALRVTLATDSTGVVSVDDNGGALTVDNGGTFAVQVDGSALTALQLIDDTVAVLGTATYAEATTKGNVVGAVRNDDLATLANTDNEIAPLQVNVAGALFAEASQQVDYVFDGGVQRTIGRASGLAATGTVAMVPAQGAGIKIRVLALSLFATSATATNIYVGNPTNNNLLGDSTNPIPMATDADGDNIAGFTLPWNPGGWFETGTANEALNITLSAAQDIVYAITYIPVA